MELYCEGKCQRGEINTLANYLYIIPTIKPSNNTDRDIPVFIWILRKCKYTLHPKFMSILKPKIWCATLLLEPKLQKL